MIAFDRDADDDLVGHNRAFHEHLQGLNMGHPGAHTRDYWDNHVVEALAQHAKVLGLG